MSPDNLPNSLAGLPESLRSRLRPQPQPHWLPPVIAVLSHEPFSDPGWVFERKFDGVRVLCYRQQDRLALLGRNKKALNNTYPEIEESLFTQPATDFIADGEIVAFAGERTSYARLQGRTRIRNRKDALATNIPVFFYLFDLLYLDGYDVRDLPLLERKKLLRENLEFGERVRFSDHRPEHGGKYFEEACRNGWEGIIGKRADSVYNSLRRSDWQKFKCTRRQEFLIAGYTAPRGKRVGFGSLLLGFYREGELVYAGRVGSGLSGDGLRDLYEKLQHFRAEECPFETPPEELGVSWVSPELVAEIAFTEWTSAGKLRHPRFLGLREDKDPRKVVME